MAFCKQNTIKRKGRMEVSLPAYPLVPLVCHTWIQTKCFLWLLATPDGLQSSVSQHGVLTCLPWEDSGRHRAYLNQGIWDSREEGKWSVGVLCQYRLWVGEGWSSFQSIRKVFMHFPSARKMSFCINHSFLFNQLFMPEFTFNSFRTLSLDSQKSFLSKSPVLTNPSHLFSRLLFHRELKIQMYFPNVPFLE